MVAFRSFAWRQNVNTFADFAFRVIHVFLHVCPTEDAHWYETSDGRLMLMISAVAVALVVFILSMIVFLCRRAKETKTSKGPM